MNESHTIISIGRSAFRGCTSLSEASIPDSVTSIGISTFDECSLSSITLPKNITEIASYAFASCPLTGIEIPEGVTVIGERAFGGCTSLSDVKLPEGLKKIETGVFENCLNLKEIEIPEGVELDKYAFSESASSYVEKVTVKGDNPVAIHGKAFDGCIFFREKMKEIVVPQDTKEIFQETWSSYSELIREEGELPFEGSGTEDDPYQIGSKANLLDLRVLVNGGDDISGKHFRVTRQYEINLSGGQWTPIGTAEHPFTGTFDGAGKGVSTLYINAPEQDNQGLFGVNAGTNLESGTIKDCVSQVNVTGENYVGSIVGKNYGTVIGCTNRNNVTGIGDSVGGITGFNGENGTVKGCTNTGNVTVAEDSAGKPGAIIGNNQNTNPDAVTDDYYQQTEDINNGITGIGTGIGSESDPSGITSGATPTKPENPPVTHPFEGEGTEQNPYKIASEEDLGKLRDLVNGGIAGTNKAGGTVINCYTTRFPRIEGGNNVGGIVGNNEGSVTDCTNTGDVICCEL